MNNIKARDIKLYRRDPSGTWRALAACTSCNVEVSKEIIAKSGVNDTTLWSDYMVRAKSWRMSAAQFVTGLDGLNEALEDTKVRVHMDVDGWGLVEGYALVTSIQLVAQGTRGLATYNTSLLGCGALSISDRKPEPPEDDFVSIPDIHKI